MSFARGISAVRVLVTGLLACAGSAAYSAPASMAASNLTAQAVDGADRLPTPLGLESDVKFWESVFHKYKPDQCILHDKEDLSIIYAVKRLEGRNQADTDCEQQSRE